MLINNHSEDLPFKEIKNGQNKTRTFAENVDIDELKWHFDEKDRIVKVIQSDNWMLQMDNQFPKMLIENKEYFIPKGVYHRVIKGKNKLVVEITEPLD